MASRTSWTWSWKDVNCMKCKDRKVYTVNFNNGTVASLRSLDWLSAAAWATDWFRPEQTDESISKQRVKFYCLCMTGRSSLPIVNNIELNKGEEEVISLLPPDRTRPSEPIDCFHSRKKLSDRFPFGCTIRLVSVSFFPSVAVYYWSMERDRRTRLVSCDRSFRAELLSTLTFLFTWLDVGVCTLYFACGWCSNNMSASDPFWWRTSDPANKDIRRRFLLPAWFLILLLTTGWLAFVALFQH